MWLPSRLDLVKSAVRLIKEAWLRSPRSTLWNSVISVADDDQTKGGRACGPIWAGGHVRTVLRRKIRLTPRESDGEPSPTEQKLDLFVPSEDKQHLARQVEIQCTESNSDLTYRLPWL